MSEKNEDVRPQVNLGYATPAARSSGVRAAGALMVTALGLILLGGCFLIGVLATNSKNTGFGSPPVVPVGLTWGEVLLEVVLYGLAFACFGGSVYLIGLGIKWMRPPHG